MLSNYEYTGLYSTVAEFQETVTILLPFQTLVKDFRYRLQPQKADLHNSVMADQEAG